MLSLSHVPAYAILKTRMWYVARLCKILLRYVSHLPMIVSFSTIVINYILTDALIKCCLSLFNFYLFFLPQIISFNFS